VVSLGIAYPFLALNLKKAIVLDNENYDMEIVLSH